MIRVDHGDGTYHMKKTEQELAQEYNQWFKIFRSRVNADDFMPQYIVSTRPLDGIDEVGFRDTTFVPIPTLIPNTGNVLPCVWISPDMGAWNGDNGRRVSLESKLLIHSSLNTYRKATVNSATVVASTFIEAGGRDFYNYKKPCVNKKHQEDNSYYSWLPESSVDNSGFINMRIDEYDTTGAHNRLLDGTITYFAVDPSSAIYRLPLLQYIYNQRTNADFREAKKKVAGKTFAQCFTHEDMADVISASTYGDSSQISNAWSKAYNAPVLKFAGDNLPAFFSVLTGTTARMELPEYPFQFINGVAHNKHDYNRRCSKDKENLFRQTHLTWATPSQDDKFLSDNFIAVDIDNPHAIVSLTNAIMSGAIPVPSYFIHNIRNGHAQVFWLIDPVEIYDKYSERPVKSEQYRMYQALRRNLTKVLGGDEMFTNSRRQSPYCCEANWVADHIVYTLSSTSIPVWSVSRLTQFFNKVGWSIDTPVKRTMMSTLYNVVAQDTLLSDEDKKRLLNDNSLPVDSLYSISEVPAHNDSRNDYDVKDYTSALSIPFFNDKYDDKREIPEGERYYQLSRFAADILRHSLKTQEILTVDQVYNRLRSIPLGKEYEEFTDREIRSIAKHAVEWHTEYVTTHPHISREAFTSYKMIGAPQRDKSNLPVGQRGASKQESSLLAKREEALAQGDKARARGLELGFKFLSESGKRGGSVKSARKAKANRASLALARKAQAEDPRRVEFVEKCFEKHIERYENAEKYMRKYNDSKQGSRYPISLYQAERICVRERKSIINAVAEEANLWKVNKRTGEVVPFMPNPMSVYKAKKDLTKAKRAKREREVEKEKQKWLEAKEKAEAIPDDVATFDIPFVERDEPLIRVDKYNRPMRKSDVPPTTNPYYLGRNIGKWNYNPKRHSEKSYGEFIKNRAHKFYELSLNMISGRITQDEYVKRKQEIWDY